MVCSKTPFDGWIFFSVSIKALQNKSNKSKIKISLFFSEIIYALYSRTKLDINRDHTNFLTALQALAWIWKELRQKLTSSLCLCQTSKPIFIRMQNWPKKDGRQGLLNLQ